MRHIFDWNEERTSIGSGAPLPSWQRVCMSACVQQAPRLYECGCSTILMAPCQAASLHTGGLCNRQCCQHCNSLLLHTFVAASCAPQPSLGSTSSKISAG